MSSTPNFPFPPTNSKVLDRVKQFLPEFVQANKELEQKIATEGKDKYQIEIEEVQNQLPSDEITSSGYEEKEENISDSSADHSSLGDDSENETNDTTNLAPIVEMNFVLGEFNDSLLAQLEGEQNDEHEEQLSKECIGSEQLDETNADESDDETDKKNAIRRLLVRPEAKIYEKPDHN